MGEGKFILVGMGGAAVVAFLLYKLAGKALDAGKAALPLINPADPNNLVNQGVTAVGSAITGDGSWTLGGALYDATHTPFDPNAGLPVETGGASGDL